MKNLTEEYVEIDWNGICSDFDLDSGDISPEQSFEMDRNLGNINEVLHMPLLTKINPKYTSIKLP